MIAATADSHASTPVDISLGSSTGASFVLSSSERGSLFNTIYLDNESILLQYGLLQSTRGFAGEGIDFIYKWCYNVSTNEYGLEERAGPDPRRKTGLILRIL